jgi:hypothetical protein
MLAHHHVHQRNVITMNKIIAAVNERHAHACRSYMTASDLCVAREGRRDRRQCSVQGGPRLARRGQRLAREHLCFRQTCVALTKKAACGGSLVIRRGNRLTRSPARSKAPLLAEAVRTMAQAAPAGLKGKRDRAMLALRAGRPRRGRHRGGGGRRSRHDPPVEGRSGRHWRHDRGGAWRHGSHLPGAGAAGMAGVGRYHRGCHIPAGRQRRPPGLVSAERQGGRRSTQLNSAATACAADS